MGVTPPLLGCDSTVTREMVLAAQQAGGNGIVAIASAYTNGQNYTQTAVDHIETLYGYGYTPVLFKPTLASEVQFRSTFEGALSYFVATNGEHAEDGGFAIKGWTAVRFENDDILTSGSTAIAAAHRDGQNFTQTAYDHIMNLYGYEQGVVLFKPTLAADTQFRSTFEGAMSYFVAQNGFASEDTGFAIKGWTAVRFENDDIILSGPTAMAMGNYYFTKADGSITKVEYSFVYFLDAMGNVRINLHHSSLPYVYVP